MRSRPSVLAPGPLAAKTGHSDGAPQDDGESITAIRHAADKGINWIDTAAVCGCGHSEELVGEALAEIPVSARPYVFTKCSLLPGEGLVSIMRLSLHFSDRL